MDRALPLSLLKRGMHHRQCVSITHSTHPITVQEIHSAREEPNRRTDGIFSWWPNKCLPKQSIRIILMLQAKGSQWCETTKWLTRIAPITQSSFVGLRGLYICEEFRDSQVHGWSILKESCLVQRRPTNLTLPLPSVRRFRGWRSIFPLRPFQTLFSRYAKPDWVVWASSIWRRPVRAVEFE